jgi:peptide/nickel transport system substrate-binding protein
LKRILAAILALATLSVSGCAVSSDVIPSTFLNVAANGSLVSLNPDVVTTLASEKIADEVANLTTESFYQLNETGELSANTGFGNVTVDSRSPFTVTYEIAEERQWSDGQPVDSADLILSLAAATSPEGRRFYSRREGNGLQFANVKSVGLKSLTLEFSQPVSDWRTALRVTAPAHIVAGVALELTSAESAKTSVIQAFQQRDAARLAALAKAYRSIYEAREGNLTEAAFVSNGAYSVVSVSPNEIITLKANSAYKGSFGPKVETVNIRLFEDSMEALSAMNDGKVDIIAATESGLAKIPDLIGMVSTLSSMKAEYSLKDSTTADMVLFNFGSESVFDPSTYGENPGRAAALRKAFMSLVPKSRIFQAAGASLAVSSADSFVYPNTSNFYKAAVSGNGSENYLLQDVEQAAEIVDASGVDTPIEVRVLFDSTNPRSVEQYKEILKHADSAGFNLVSVASSTPSRHLLSGNFDVFIGPRPLLGVSGSDPMLLTTSSITRYQDKSVNALLVKYAKATKEIDQAAVLERIDARLFATGYGLPLYQAPNLVIYRSSVSGLRVAPFGDSATWGYWTWSVSPK